MQDYLQSSYEARQRRLGEKARLFGGAATIFPNMTFQPRQPRSIAVWNPRGPHKTEARRFYLVDKDMPEELKALMRAYLLRGLGPGGMTEQDDMENWNYAALASRGTVARRYPYNYQQGLRHESPVEGLNGAVVSDVMSSEENARTLYRRWVQLMEAGSWDELRAGAK